MTIGDAILHLRSNHNDTEAINVIYVVNENGELVDDIPIEKGVNLGISTGNNVRYYWFNKNKADLLLPTKLNSGIK
jgi:hypothetical protein